ncbi:MAG: 3-hydroxyacyl-ACP dehydratase FabZ family protein [Bdellovibrionota bacterium]|nr:3-hydroxyacyl-ACP dehydratase FabZ family protein [Bdellovibrionota bacterium]
MDQEVLDAIPQRPPFLFVDKIIERDKSQIWAQKKLEGSEDFFKGHFPGRPIMPGVLLQEAAFQAGALLMGGSNKEQLGVVTRADKVKFRGFVGPQDVLDIKVEKTEELANAVYFKGRIFVKDKCVLSLNFACALVEK